ncbi:hypothetical protein RFI_37648, partial [Reticulomyxa filosa]
MSLVVGREDHCIYLSLCKTLDYVLVRVDNRWTKTIPLNKSHPINEHGLIQPYLVAYFKSNSLDIDNNKEWLKEYIKNATILEDSDSNGSMSNLYCNDNSPPREGNVSSIVKDCPYRPIQTDAQNCYMRSHNVGYRIRLGDAVYEWFRNQECKIFVFNKTDYNLSLMKKRITMKNMKKCIMKMAMMQTLVAKAKINAIQNE